MRAQKNKYMKSFAQIVSPYRGSEATYEAVRAQIEERWGPQVAKEYDPRTTCAPFSSWAAAGFRVKRHEKALKSITFIEVKNEKGDVEKKVKRVVNLFHSRQVEPAAV